MTADFKIPSEAEFLGAFSDQKRFNDMIGISEFSQKLTSLKHIDLAMIVAFFLYYRRCGLYTSNDVLVFQVDGSERQNSGEAELKATLP